MLLVHGENLGDAHFNIEATGIKLDRTQVSTNGHWAFLWIDTSAASAQTLRVTASNSRGCANRTFVLAERSNDSNAHRGFSSADVLYLIMTDRFAQGHSAVDPADDDRPAPRGWHGGNLAGIEEHLDYLHNLGVTAVWTTPVDSNASMPMAYHGYAATDLYAVDPHFGTLKEYRHLSDDLHAHGMKLVIDWVPNHVGVEHPWVHDPPAPEWFHGSLATHRSAQHDFYQLVNEHAPPQAWRDIVQGWFTDAMPDLNQENPLVERYLIQNALWWVETANLDGIRLDTFPYVSRAFWHDFHSELHSAYPNLTTVGEVFNGDPEVTSYYAGGTAHEGPDGNIDTGLYTPFDFPVCYALRDILAHNKPMTELTGILRQDALYPHPERLALFFGNHDTTRFLTEAAGSTARLKLALGLLATLRGMPQLYSGDEIGMAGGQDPDNRHDFPGGFAGDTHNAFTSAGRTAPEQDMFAWTSGLLKLRLSSPAMQTGIEQNLFVDEDAFAFVRAPNQAGCAPDHSGDRILVVANKAGRSKAIDLALHETALAGCTEFHAEAPAVGDAPGIDGDNIHLIAPAESIVIYKVR